MSTKPSATNQDKYRPPFISLLFSGFWSLISYQLYLWGQQGEEWSTFGCLLTGFMAIGQVIKSMNDRFKRSALRLKQQRFKTGAKAHGQGRFANAQDITDSELFSDRQGIFLGTLRTGKNSSIDVFFDGPQSLSLIAPPGEGKTMSLVVPTCLANPEQNLIINDPSGEIYALCKAALEQQNYHVVVMTPFPEEVSQRLGEEVIDVGLDLFSGFDADMNLTSIRPRLLAIMTWVMPGRPDMDEKSEYFFKYARMLGGFLALKELAEGRKPTLPAIRRHLMEGLAYIRELFEQAEGSTAFGGVYEELAKSLGGLLVAAPQQFAGGYGIAEQALDVFDHFSSLGKHTAESKFDPRVLKDPHQKTALFLISTLEMMETVAPVTAMTLTYLFGTLAADKQAGRCTAIIDECGSLVMPRLATSLLFYRKANLRCLLIWQDLAGQAEKNYGKVGLRQIMSASKLKIAMGLQEPETLEMFSKLCGTQAVVDPSLSDRAAKAEPLPELTVSLNHRSLPLLRADEIRMMSGEEMLIVGGNLPPLQLQKVPYWKRPHLKERAGHSPYYHG
ncbi:Type IV secretory system Conjugative DNA transfer [Polystyrenella longa]|uniref:Type IV secretory system Conjugative DNA transfer n=1 Tax=Polystyrenella longa TaxID=2528007 RepID=A0A518CNE8_9PLAN|nr:type IV secretory system conjugative DNA transfer family protein [Polystyrenella longa]QDU80738.1 Type IV secretory system Conjugative DNA transfer [Polystyrenella longa]